MMAMVAGCLVAAGPWAPPARAQQPTGFTHAWGTSSGTIFNDEGRGIAVLNDGSVLWAGTTLNPGGPGDDASVPMSVVRRYTSSGSVSWSREFLVQTPGVDVVAIRGLAGGERRDEFRLPTAYVCGRFKGSVNFGGGFLPAAGDSGFIAKVDQTTFPGGGAGSALAWPPYRVLSTGTALGNRAMVFALATASLARVCEGINDGTTGAAAAGGVIAGGFFNGPATFSGEGVLSFCPPRPTNPEGDEAFVLVLSEAGSLVRGFTFGGPGNQRVTAVAVDERTNDVFVAGWFDSGQTNFNPNVSPAIGPPSYQDGRDLFVARYRVPDFNSQEACQGQTAVELVWVYTWGAPASAPSGTFFEDEATGIALGVNDDAQLSTLAFVSGWTSDAAVSVPGSGSGNPVFMAVGPGATGQTGALKWVYTPQAQGDDRALAVTVDGLGRPVFTGHSGCLLGSTFACEGETATTFDFNPGATTLKFPGASLQAFVARFHPTNIEPGTSPPAPTLDWAYVTGGGFNESGAAIAFDPVYTSRFAWTGSFGDPDAFPGGYTIDLDPGPGSSPVTSAGDADAFISTLDPSQASNVGFQVSLVLSNDCTMTLDPLQGQPPREQFTSMLRGVREAIESTEPRTIPYVGDARPGGGTRVAAVQVNAVFDQTPARSITQDRTARQVMPWTIFDAQTAPLFARRLGAMPALESTGIVSSTLISAGLLEAGVSLTRARLPAGSNPHASVLYVGFAARNNTQAAVAAARDAVRGGEPNRFDRVCVVGSGAAGTVPIGSTPLARAWALTNAIAPVVPGAQTPEDIDRGSTGIAAYWETMRPPAGGDWVFRAIMIRMLQRLSWCPSDFNRDECTDNNGGATDDRTLWGAPPLSNVYRDWNFDLLFDDPLLLRDDDRPKLEAGLAPLPPVPNRFLCNTCPQH
jgi:hypothetical protein